MEKELLKAVKKLTRTTDHWLYIKAILEADIKANLELIAFIDKYIKEKEDKISKLN